ncbi:hypothetical protein [Blastomonas aquatica]|uniref:Uncharacterized protein n=1 Tax=Blastomonas aquatica TaxID=1510276 RepID=A0ABQ1J086_9SPHN|nr:hypothetical protein [Blastomonas aquatica]GGB56960.1 hypothetical protein GCM10010833_09590 [Blastomonas aquatica]
MTLPVIIHTPALTSGAIDTSTIPGWGVDADPLNDPTYPIRDRARDPGLTSDWERPTIQHPDVEILQSIEHIRQPAVVGTSVPPSGLSGMMRRTAFRWSESNWTHWLLLMGADRVNVIEGIVDDLAHARIPNIPAEMGIRSELAHNKRGFAKKLAVGGLIGVVAVGLLKRRRQQ